ncbi:head-tail adaptor protein [Limosilactobacillus fermentum]|uniref:phage head closure protein n=1 Tax=Limosilactobacillus fermentum TaxID=1613 RepID=UPI0021A757F2|nr:phage head closure protein [Limosilactobacillus fermentum]MCT2875863.1 head-tail adaptor protein [Limosilactobacillus fermentum]
MKIPLYRFNKIIEFGKPKTVPSRTIEGSRVEFQVTKTVHGALYQRTQTQQYQLVGTDLEKTIVVAVRAENNVDDSLLARFKGETQLYRVANVSKDESNDFPHYDLVTLAKKEGK